MTGLEFEPGYQAGEATDARGFRRSRVSLPVVVAVLLRVPLSNPTRAVPGLVEKTSLLERACEARERLRNPTEVRVLPAYSSVGLGENMVEAG